jgi:CubicO group peptidase (beta-lactamase class C family)
VPAVLNRVVADYRQFVHGWFPATEQAAPGITAAVLSDRGAWAGAAGRDGDGRPLTPKAMMNIASIPKAFAAVEVLHLAASGKLDLDAPVSRYVKHRLANSGFALRQALGMLSGLPDFRDPDRERLSTTYWVPAADTGRRWTRWPTPWDMCLRRAPVRPTAIPTSSCWACSSSR